jgi:ribonuclease J
VVKILPPPAQASTLVSASGELEADASGLTAMCYTDGDASIMVDCGAPPGQNGNFNAALQRLLEAPNVAGVVITHPHQDHWSLLPVLGGKLPIHMEQLTREFMERQRRQARRGNDDSAAASVRAPDQVITYDADSSFEVGSFLVRSIVTAHSIPNSSMLLIRTPGGKWVLHTGDFKLNGMDWRIRLLVEKALREIGRLGVEIMYCDNLQCHREGFTPEECHAVRGVAEVILQAPGSVFVAAFASNLDRLGTLAEFVQDCGRPIYFKGTSMLFAKELLERGQVLPIGGEPHDQTVFFVTGCQGEENSTLCREIIDCQPELRLREGDTVILSSTAIPGNEERIKNMIERLLARGCRVVIHEGQIQKLGLQPNERLSEAFVHVGGRGQGGDLRRVLELVRPKKIIPAVRTSPQIEAFRKIADEFGAEVPEPADNHVVL